MAKQREQESALARVKRQQAELDEMRLKYTIHNEEKITKNEQNELQTMRNELQPTRETDGKFDSVPFLAKWGAFPDAFSI